jgi:hypothetical protein
VQAEEPNIGFATRSMVIVFFGVGGAFTKETETLPLGLLLGISIVILMFAMFSGLSMLRQMRLRQPNKNWDAPSWRTGPFSGPAHFLHACGWSFVAFGVVSLIADSFRMSSLFVGIPPMMAIPFGAGLLAGLNNYYRRSEP